jgi:SAM-dependent methyltransferase
MASFSTFDRRRYRTLPAREAYALWSSTYETTIKPDMDLWLLDRVDSVPWSEVVRAVDLGCGTGRTGSWLKSRGVQVVDGVDLTAEMLEGARRRGIFYIEELPIRRLPSPLRPGSSRAEIPWPDTLGAAAACQSYPPVAFGNLWMAPTGSSTACTRGESRFSPCSRDIVFPPGMT